LDRANGPVPGDLRREFALCWSSVKRSTTSEEEHAEGNQVSDRDRRFEPGRQVAEREDGADGVPVRDRAGRRAPPEHRHHAAGHRHDAGDDRRAAQREGHHPDLDGHPGEGPDRAPLAALARGARVQRLRRGREVRAPARGLRDGRRGLAHRAAHHAAPGAGELPRQHRAGQAVPELRGLPRGPQRDDGGGGAPDARRPPEPPGAVGGVRQDHGHGQAEGEQQHRQGPDLPHLRRGARALPLQGRGVPAAQAPDHRGREGVAGEGHRGQQRDARDARDRPGRGRDRLRRRGRAAAQGPRAGDREAQEAPREGPRTDRPGDQPDAGPDGRTDDRRHREPARGEGAARAVAGQDRGGRGRHEQGQRRRHPGPGRDRPGPARDRHQRRRPGGRLGPDLKYRPRRRQEVASSTT